MEQHTCYDPIIHHLEVTTGGGGVSFLPLLITAFHAMKYSKQQVIASYSLVGEII